MADLEGLAVALIGGKREDVAAKVQEAIDEGISPAEVLNNGLVAGMSVVGERFRRNIIYVPEVLIAARAMKAGMELLKPLLEQSGVEPVGRVVVGTVKGDLHDIGKNLVTMMLQGGGFEVIDLGTDVAADKFVEAAKENRATIIAMSALLTTTMPQMAEVVKAAKASGIDGLRCLIGGAPVTQNYANEIGADGYAADAASAVEVAQNLIDAA